jgi:hypothetical protein
MTDPAFVACIGLLTYSLYVIVGKILDEAARCEK